MLSRSSYRTCFLLSTGVLVVACLCCAAQALLLALQQAAPAADADTLTRRLEEGVQAGRLAQQALADLWGGLESGEPGLCSSAAVEIPPVFLIGAAAERRFPHLAEATRQLNHAIDQMQWSLRAWHETCSQAAPDAQALAGGVAQVEEARQALEEAQSALVMAQGG